MRIMRIRWRKTTMLRNLTVCITPEVGSIKNLRIAALTIAGTLLVVGLTVPLGTALAGSKHHLSFKSVDVDLPSVTLTQALGINAEGDIVGRYNHRCADLAFSGGCSMHGYEYLNGA